MTTPPEQQPGLDLRVLQEQRKIKKVIELFHKEAVLAEVWENASQ